MTPVYPLEVVHALTQEAVKEGESIDIDICRRNFGPDGRNLSVRWHATDVAKVRFHDRRNPLSRVLQGCPGIHCGLFDVRHASHCSGDGGSNRGLHEIGEVWRSSPASSISPSPPEPPHMAPHLPPTPSSASLLVTSPHPWYNPPQ